MYNIVSIADRKIERSSWENVESTKNQKLKIRYESSVKLIGILRNFKDLNFRKEVKFGGQGIS